MTRKTRRRRPRTKKQAASERRKRERRRAIVKRKNAQAAIRAHIQHAKEAFPNLSETATQFGHAHHMTRAALNALKRHLLLYAEATNNMYDDVLYRLPRDEKELLENCDPAYNPGGCAIEGDRIVWDDRGDDMHVVRRATIVQTYKTSRVKVQDDDTGKRAFVERDTITQNDGRAKDAG